MKKSSPRIYYFLLILCIEKVVQHIYVTYAFATDIDTIRTDVVFDYRIFMYSGMIIALGFFFSAYGILKEQKWSLNLLWILGWTDFVGEFIAQGGRLQFVPLSYLLAIVIIIIVPIYKHRINRFRSQEDLIENS